MKVYYLALLLTGLCLLKSTVSFSQVAANVTDSLALVDLYNSTNGPDWYFNRGASWLNGPVSTWYGISLDAGGNVIAIDLEAVHFGSIPASIGNLASLQIFTLSADSISADLPASIGNLSSLRFFNLGNYCGNIPSSIGNLVNLKILIIQNSGPNAPLGVPVGPIPASIGNLVNDTTLILIGQFTGGLPASIGNLASVRNLELNSFNQMGGTIPSTIGNLTSLRYLDLSANGFTGSIPASFGNLVNLTHLNLYTNNLTGSIPSEVGGLPALTYFDLHSNKYDFTGLEGIAKAYPFVQYLEQYDTLHIDDLNGLFSVSAGGTLSNNTYVWGVGGGRDSTKVGDSTIVPTVDGDYGVSVTNSIVKGLTLSSSPLFYVAVPQVYPIDPYPSFIDSSGDVAIPNPQLIDKTKTVVGGAADGLTKIMLVTYSSSPLTFTLPAGSGDAGTIGTVEDPDAGSGSSPQSVTIAPVNNLIVAVYTVPDGLGAGYPLGYRTVNIEVTYPNYPLNPAYVPIRLVSPPVVLVHGMWSSPAIWGTGGMVGALDRAGFPFPPFLADYSAESASTFDPNSPNSIFGRSAVQKACRDGLQQYRNNQYAVSQVDVVGHSLGGLMARSFAQQGAPQYSNKENYYSGYFHKLITLGTPHRGSPIGPALWNAQNNIVLVPVPVPLVGGPVLIPTQLKYLLAATGNPIGLCHKDFGKDSAGIQHLKETPSFHSFSISGNWASVPSPTFAQTASYTALNLLLRYAIGETHAQIFTSNGCSAEPNTDLIVEAGSQTGGISQFQNFNGVGHSVPELQTETNDTSVQNAVVNLLLSQDVDSFGSVFPAPSTIPDQGCANGSNSTKPSLQNRQGKGAVVLGGDSANSFVKIQNPASGVAYSSGSGATINLQFVVNGTVTPGESLFVIDGVGWFAAANQPPYSVNVRLPSAVSIGSHNVVLLVKDSITGLLYADTSSLVIRPVGQLDSISTNPGAVSLDSSGRVLALSVEGFYSGGQPYNTVDISSSSAGTTYTTQKGSAIIGVSSNGQVTAVSPGTDTILVSNGGVAVKVPVSVNSNFLLRTMFSNTINFSPISDQVIGNPPFALDASAGSGDEVLLSVVSGPATIQNGILSITGAGKVTVKASDPGNAYFSAAVPVLQTYCVNPLPASAIAGDTISCISAAKYTVAGMSGIRYQWSISGGGLVGSGDTVVMINWTDTGVYTISVMPMTSDSCYGGAAQLTVDITGPPQPVITGTATTLTSSDSSGNQWFLNGATVAGANGQSYYPTVAGDYTVQSTVNGCAGPLSNVYVFKFPSTDSILVYPNPASTVVNVVNNGSHVVDIQLFDLSGRGLETISGITGAYEMDVAWLAKGAYVVLVTDETNGTRWRKLVIKK